jgi:hypothetical protein
LTPGMSAMLTMPAPNSFLFFRECRVCD